MTNGTDSTAGPVPHGRPACAGTHRAGLYEMTPDRNALIGEAPDVRGLLYATGFPGHGFLQAPAAGEAIRDLFLHRTPFIDVAPLAATRFTTSATRPETTSI
jgi:sarcosine oxidase, subunit beta